MAYDTDLETKIDEVIAGWRVHPTKKKMFGGLGYFVHGNMSFGIHQNDLIIRATEEQGKELLMQDGIKVFDMTDRPMKSWFLANSAATQTKNALEHFLRVGRDFALKLTPK